MDADEKQMNAARDEAQAAFREVAARYPEVGAALPFLMRAREVQVTVFDADKHRHMQRPGGQ